MKKYEYEHSVLTLAFSYLSEYDKEHNEKKWDSILTTAFENLHRFSDEKRVNDETFEHYCNVFMLCWAELRKHDEATGGHCCWVLDTIFTVLENIGIELIKLEKMEEVTV